MTEEKLKLCNELWNEGLNVEMSHKENPKAQEQMKYVHQKQIPIILWIGEEEVSNGTVKIKEYSMDREPFKE